MSKGGRLRRERDAVLASSRSRVRGAPRPRGPFRRWLPFLIVLALVGGGLWGIGRLGIRRSARGALEAVPSPDLSGVEGPVARRLILMREAVVGQPRSAEVWGRFAMALDVHGFDEAAVEAYRRGASLDPDTFSWPYDLAVVLQEMGEPEALDWFERSLALRSDYAPLYVRYGRALFDRGDFDSAADAFERALQLDSTLALARLGRARVALAQGDLETSAAHLRRGIEYAPGDESLHGTLAEVLRRSGDTIQATLETWRARLSTRPATMPDVVHEAVLQLGVGSRSYIDRGLAYLDARRPDLAEKAFRGALVGRPESPEAHDGLGTALQRLGRYAEAETEHERALSVRGDYKEAMANLSVALFAQGKVSEAIGRAEEAIRIDSTFTQAYLILGGFLSYEGKPGSAARTYRAGLARASFDPRIAIRLAWLLATGASSALRDGSEAVRLAEIVGALNDYSVPEEVDVLAAAYAEAGDFGQAVSFVDRAYQLAIRSGMADLAEAIDARAALYRAGRPYRE